MHTDVAGRFSDYLHDESRWTGCADVIVFPETEADIVEALQYAAEHGMPVTSQGSRTSLTGSAIPQEGMILSFVKMNRVLGMRKDPGRDRYLLRVQPGVLLGDVREMIAQKSFDTTGWDNQSLEAFEECKRAPAYMYAPDPTETTASVGGMASCNASGARSFFYGATRNHIESVRVCFVDGTCMEIRRGQFMADGRTFALKTKGVEFTGMLPESYTSPAIKNAAGYHVEDNMDLLDLFIGSEGTLGVFSEIELVLLPEPAVQWGVTCFFPAEEDAVEFVTRVRRRGAAAIEFFDHGALDLMRSQQKTNSLFSDLPEMDERFHTAVYLEFHDDNEDVVEEKFLDIAEVLADCNSSDEWTWMAITPAERERWRRFRHSVPEAINQMIAERKRIYPELTKLGTDMAVPDDRLKDVVAIYHETLDAAGMDYLMFGHIGNNHIHVNILPRDPAEYQHGKEIYLTWAEKVVAMGGTVAAEHGIGKLKVAFLRKMVGDRGLEEMRAVKAVFDPDFRLNKGNLFD